MAEHYRYPRFAIGLELAIGQAEFIEQVEIESIALGGSVKANQVNVTTAFSADAAGAGLIHGEILEREGRWQRRYAARR
jgi:hypothetical protein